jgi:hypothetical protein
MVVNDSVILYTMNQVIDSSGRTGLPVQLQHPMGPNSTIFQLQFMQWTKTLVDQTAVINTQTGKLIKTSLEPSIWKDQSTWQAYGTEAPRTHSQDGRLAASDAVC